MTLFSINEQVSIRQLGQDYLAYSAQTNQTIVLESLAYRLLKLLAEPLNIDDLLAIVKNEAEFAGMEVDDKTVYLETVLRELSARGFIVKVLTGSDY